MARMLLNYSSMQQKNIFYKMLHRCSNVLYLQRMNTPKI